ncbi:hypothetical protein Plhal304r1_c020g0071591 [Plasmopara halstedii]
MKISRISLLVVVNIPLLDTVNASCLSSCQSQLVHYREEACQKWRERLPRPDLFNHCGQGFNKGKTAGCEGYCQTVPELGTMKSLRLDACASLKGLPPSERQHACQAGFSAALDLAKDAAKPEVIQEAVEVVKPSTQESQGDAENGRKLEENSAPKKKVNGKKSISGTDRRNLLEDARKEAEAAFASVQENKAAEL